MIVTLIAIFGCGPNVDFRNRSMVEIIESPRSFEGQRVGLHGYYGENVLGPFLFLTKEHAGMVDLSNAIRLGRTVEGAPFASIADCRPGHLAVFGRLGSLDVGGFGITDIERAVEFDLSEQNDGGTCYKASGGR